MSKKPALVAVLAAILLSWFTYIILSLHEIGKSLPELPVSSFPSPNSETDSNPVAIVSAVTQDPGDGPKSTVASADPVDVTTELRDLELGNVLEVSSKIVRTLDPPLSMQERCALVTEEIDYGLLYRGKVKRAVEFYSALPSAELKAMADQKDDALANFFYARGIIQRVYNSSGRSDIQPQSISDESVETMLEHYIHSIRNHIRGGAADLAWMYYILGDKVESVAWLRVDEQMGGDTFERFQNNPAEFYTFDQNDRSQGAIRAQELIVEHDLRDGLSRPKECTE